MAPAPVVTGISPNEATPGTKITIRGENFGLVASDLLGINILGKYVWKTFFKLIEANHSQNCGLTLFFPTDSQP